MVNQPPALWRQGDILLMAIPMPDEAGRALLKRRPRPILAEGERTGHRHEIADRRTARLYSRVGVDHLFLEVTAPHTEVIHPEHGPIVLSRGWYEVWRQREWNGLSYAMIGD